MQTLDYLLLFISWLIFFYYISGALDKQKNLSNAVVQLTLNLKALNKKYEDITLEYSNHYQDSIKQIQQKDNQIEQLQLNYHKRESSFNEHIIELKSEINSIQTSHQLELKEKISKARKDAIDKSRSVIRGQASEHLAPYIIPNTNPKDYRFMGNPIDYICFEGLSDILDKESDVITSVKFIDIKTGKSSLTKTQRRIRDAIAEGRVSFELINLDEIVHNDKINEEQENKSIEKSKD